MNSPAGRCDWLCAKRGKDRRGGGWMDAPLGEKNRIEKKEKLHERAREFGWTDTKSVDREWKIVESCAKGLRRLQREGGELQGRGESWILGREIVWWMERDTKGKERKGEDLIRLVGGLSEFHPHPPEQQHFCTPWETDRFLWCCCCCAKIWSFFVERTIWNTQIARRVDVLVHFLRLLQIQVVFLGLYFWTWHNFIHMPLYHSKFGTFSMYYALIKFGNNFSI